MKVSVIIPSYNSAAFVARAVRSVMAQDFSEIETICVDDGSSDDTVQILNQLSVEFPQRIQIFRRENRGAGAARNFGVEKSSGEYLQFLDADDELLPGKIADDLRLVGEQKPAIVAGSFSRISNGSSSVVPVEKNDPWFLLFNGLLGCTCSNLFNRNIFLSSGGWSEELKSSQETDLMHRILKLDDFVFFNTMPNTVVHTGDSIISRHDPSGNLKRYFQVRLSLFDSILSRGENTRIRNNAGYMFYGILHRLYRYDKVAAVDMLREVEKRGIKVTSGPGVSGAYRTLCAIFGFSLTEKLFYSGR